MPAKAFATVRWTSPRASTRLGGTPLSAASRSVGSRSSDIVSSLRLEDLSEYQAWHFPGAFAAVLAFTGDPNETIPETSCASRLGPVTLERPLLECALNMPRHDISLALARDQRT